MKILLVEDDEIAASPLAEALTTYHYTVERVADAQTGVELAQAYNYDLILLDILASQLDGISLCQQLRDQGHEMPILLLSGKDSSSDRVIALEAGADDYVVKPYNLPELIARIRALLRRGRSTLPAVLTWEKLQLDTETSMITYEGKVLHLTPKEYGLLELFLHNPWRIFSRRAILDRIWSSGEFPTEEAVTTQIKGLRQKLKAAGMTTNLIETVYGLGYRLQSPPEGEELNVGKFLTQRQSLYTDIAKVEDSNITSPVPLSSPARLLVIDDDTVLAEQLKVEATAWNLQVEVAPNLKVARKAIAFHLPDIILLDLTFPDTGENGLTLLAQLHHQHPELPVLVFTAHNQLRERVEVARLGASSFLHKPIPPAEIFTAVRNALNHHSVVEAKVMVVDDDPSVLAHLRVALQRQGLQVTTLKDPQRFWDVLEATNPDLLILDVEMPIYSGLELCQVVRNDSHWSHLPILFLPAHADAQVVHEGFTVGADDYVNKPIDERELLDRIFKHLERRKA